MSSILFNKAQEKVVRKKVKNGRGRYQARRGILDF